jgi:hypothetical protein
MTLLASLAVVVVAWLKKTISIVYGTPKVREKKSNFWGVFIMKLTFEDKIQICKLLKQGCTFVWNKNRLVDHNNK